MADDTLALQAAVVARLRADAGLLALVAGRVYDEPPQGALAPWVAIGPTFGQPFEAVELDGWETVITVETWTRDAGAAALRAIMAAVYASLHAAELTLSGRSFVYGRLLDQRDFGPDPGRWRRGQQRFEFITHL